MIEDRYESFTVLDPPVAFNEYFKDLNYERVQVHMVDPKTKIVVGFVGIFKWIDNKLIPLDGDYYNSDMKVIKYSVVNYDMLDILVGDDW